MARISATLHDRTKAEVERRLIGTDTISGFVREAVENELNRRKQETGAA